MSNDFESVSDALNGLQNEPKEEPVGPQPGHPVGRDADVVDIESDAPGLNPDGRSSYSLSEVANLLDVHESTIRKKWFSWLEKVAPIELLKDGKRFTQLAVDLLFRFKEIAPKDRKQWSVDMRAQYSEEWDSAGIIEGELVPEEVGGMLSLRNSMLEKADLSLAASLSEVENMIASMSKAESLLSEAEVKKYQQRGVRRGIERYRTERAFEEQTYRHLQRKQEENDNV